MCVLCTSFDPPPTRGFSAPPSTTTLHPRETAVKLFHKNKEKKRVGRNTRGVLCTLVLVYCTYIIIIYIYI